MSHPTTLRLFSAGSNAKGQLANGSLEDSSSFVEVGSGLPAGRVCDVCGGANHTLLLLDVGDGTGTKVYGAGDNSKGQIPRSLETGTMRFEEVRFFGQGRKVVKIAAAWETSYFVLRSESDAWDQSDVLVSSGSNEWGDLGVGDSPPISATHVVSFRRLLSSQRARYRITDLRAGVHHIVASLEVSVTRSHVGRTQLVVGWGASQRKQLGQPKALHHASLPVRIPVPSPVMTMAVGSQHTVLLHASGGITSYGSNRKDQLSSLDSISSATGVGCTWNGTYILTPSGLLSTGSSSKGQLGRIEPQSSSSSPTPTPSTGLGQINFEGPIGKIACGSEHVLLVSNGELWAWGWNEHGNLGLGHLKDVFVPTKVPIPVSGKVVDAWAGCGNSWILVECDASE